MTSAELADNAFFQRNCLLVERSRIAENGEWNLSGERYRENTVTLSDWPFVPVGQVFDKSNSTVHPDLLNSTVTYIGLENITRNTGMICGDLVVDNPSEIKSLKNVFVPNEILYGKLRPNLNKVLLSDREGICSTDIFVIRSKDNLTIPAFYSYIFRSNQFNDAVLSELKGAQLPRVGWSSFAEIKIPLPPIDVQKEIVAEIEDYQKIIDGARQVVENYKPRIPIDPDWPMVELGEVSEINPETIIPETEYAGGTFEYIDISSVENGTGLFLGATTIHAADAPSRARRKIQIGDVLLSTVRPNLKAFTLLQELPERAVASTGFAVLRSNHNRIIPKYLLEAVMSDAAVKQMVSMMGKGAYPSINQKDVSMVCIHLPDLDTQRTIVTKIEEEQRLVNANKELIWIFEAKIKATINRVWGEKELTICAA